VHTCNSALQGIDVTKHRAALWRIKLQHSTILKEMLRISQKRWMLRKNYYVFWVGRWFPFKFCCSHRTAESKIQNKIA